MFCPSLHPIVSLTLTEALFCCPSFCVCLRPLFIIIISLRHSFFLSYWCLLLFLSLRLPPLAKSRCQKVFVWSDLCVSMQVKAYLRTDTQVRLVCVLAYYAYLCVSKQVRIVCKYASTQVRIVCKYIVCVLAYYVVYILITQGLTRFNQTHQSLFINSHRCI